MATIKGVWVFNSPNWDMASQTVNFTSNGTNYSVLDFTFDDMGIHELYYGSTKVYNVASGWTNEAYKTVDFGTIEQTVTDAWYSSFTKSFVEQKSATVTYDLTSLNLGEGTHSISVIGKADGYKNSAASNTVQYTVEPQGVTLAKGTYVCNSTPTMSTVSQQMNFTSNGIAFIRMDCNQMTIDYRESGGTTHAAYIANAMVGSVGWQNDNYKYVTLDTDQTVSAEFGEWFNANFALKTYSIQLSNIGNWSMYYVVDNESDDYNDNFIYLSGAQSVTLNVKSHIYCLATSYFIPGSCVFTNCRVEWKGDNDDMCRIYPTGDNAVAQLWATD